MMLVSHRKHFIYTKTVRTASTSVESYFERWCMPEGQWEANPDRDATVTEAGIIGFRGGRQAPAECQWRTHMPAVQIREQIGAETWSRYFKFCVIRNPYDKAISMYFFFLKRYRRQAAAQGVADPEPVSFERFLRRGSDKGIRRVGALSGSAGGPATDRDKYLIDGESCMDFFVRYETLHTDLERVCERIGVPWEPERMPRFNSGLRPADVDPVQLFTPEARQVVERRYAYEFENFGYRFPW